MDKRHSGRRALAAAIAIALLLAGLWGAYRVGWREGYRLGWLVERSGEGEGASVEPYDYRSGTRWPFAGPRVGGWTRYRGLGHLNCLRPLFTFLLLALVLSAIARFFGFWAWRRGWWPAGKGWYKHGPHGSWPHGHPPHGPCRPHGPRGPMPPWCWGEEEAADQASADQEPADERSGEEQVGKVRPK